MDSQEKLAMWKRMLDSGQMPQWEYDSLVKGEQELIEMMKLKEKK